MNYRIKTITENIPNGSKVLHVGAAKIQPEKHNDAHYHVERVAGECIGIDIDIESINELPEYDIIHANAETFDLNETFDVVVAGEIIEHLDRPGDMIDRCYEHVSPGGKVILSTPYPFMILRTKEALTSDPRAFDDHVSWFCPRTLGTLLNRHGFVVTDCEFTRPKHIGLSWLCTKLGFERLGAPGFVMVATKRTNG